MPARPPTNIAGWQCPAKGPRMASNRHQNHAQYTTNTPQTWPETPPTSAARKTAMDRYVLVVR
eukprot:13317691-Alexandrium_andersonii.AAC.1